MSHQLSPELLKTLKGGFDAESQEDLSQYFDFITSELQRITALAEEKNDAVSVIDSFIAGNLSEDEEIKKRLPNKETAQKARAEIKKDIDELVREFEILETLINSAVAEVKFRVTGERE